MADKSKTKTVIRGRNAETGQFISVKEARKEPSTSVVERVPKPGFGVVGKKN